jgi:hypothetical protein
MDYRNSTETTILRIKSQSRWNSAKVTAWGTVFLVFVLTIYLMFGFTEVGTARPIWFKFVTSFFSTIAMLGTFSLCWRNSLQVHIPSGQKVWGLFSWATIAILMSQMLTAIWELGFGLKSGASPADLCNVAFYVLTIWGLGLVMAQQKVALSRIHMLMVGIVAVAASIIAMQIMISATFSTSTSVSGVAWANSIDHLLQPLVEVFGLFYLFSDVALIVMAAILFLGFWGGRMGTTWQIVSQGLACIYLADMRFAFLAKTGGYESGDLLEVFWIAGFVQLSIAAALEWENAHRVKRLLNR